LIRHAKVASAALLAACLFFPGSNDAFAASPVKATSKTKVRKKAPRSPSPARPTGVATRSDVSNANDAGANTITEYQNELGQTVYSVVPSHFDSSPPLREMVATAAARGLSAGGEEEDEAPTNPMLPASRIIRSDIPDPVVQSAPSADTLPGGKFALAAPTTGFNFQGVGINGGTPSDCNGSVGSNQFVETVNVQYQIWSLNYSTKVATPIFPSPQNINTLWLGFGGACQSQNSGDPIVIYDKTAKRWLISQFTTGGTFLQCVAISQTEDAAGAYYRYAFTVPAGRFGDYPHFGAWTDAYYMMAHGFGGPGFAALFAAMDRPKMLAGNPAATWIVIADPNEGGHMPADLDGFALPPSKAPGIFVSLHFDGMYIYRMKVNFASPASTTKTLQAIVPVAAASAACGGGTCIPQPGTGNTLDSIADRLMFRAAYRNFIDHESLVVSHSVDPSVSGLVSGVRWYDFRLSGNPDATCPTYPCIYQQGTIADVPNGRSRWMPTLAMDTAENILVGYTATGKTNGSENHSSRYTGRAKDDPPGTMTVPETTIVNGTANNTGNTRWGDYFSMSVDPVDDCTFWFVSQYYGAQNSWSTRIASATFPVGTGPGECPVTTCNPRPTFTPTIGSATVPGDNQITVTWTAVVPTPGAYAIERAEGACGSGGLFRPLAAVPGTATSFTDTSVVGGTTYSYQVRVAADAAGKCQAQLASLCRSATATGTCNLKPSFAGADDGSSGQGGNCGVTIGWAPATSHCPLSPNVRYNIYRGTVPDFVPSAANRIATCVNSPSSYVDTNNLSSGTTYYYVVRAEDGTTGNGGACGGGNEESNSVRVAATPYAAGTQAAVGTWTDGGGDGTAQLSLNVAGPGDTSDQAWRIIKTASDPGANHTPGGAFAYRNAGPAPGNTYTANTCAEMQAPPLTVGASTVNLQYWERHQVEYHWDALAVEFAVNGGTWADIPAPSNSPGEGCAASDDTTGWEALSCTLVPPANACSYTDTKNVFTGPLASGTSCNDWVTGATASPYAHRCHQITGLTPNDTIQFRWRFSSDSGTEYAGFYLDDVAVTNVLLPNACTPDTCSGQLNGTACDDGNACTTGDACGGGVCAGGSSITPPPETAGLSVDADKVTYSWSAAAFAAHYEVVRGSLSALPAGPGVADEACFGNLPGPSLQDSTPPDPGTGFWYLSRGVNTCGNGSYGQQSNGTPRITTTCP
jgi:hypothetical protein